MPHLYLPAEGFEIRRRVLDSGQLPAFREEADAVAKVTGSACVRHLRAKSKLFDALASSPEIRSLLPPGLDPVRSILFDKTPAENWPVSWHQDLTIAVKEKRPVDDYGPWSFKDGSPHVQPPVALLENMVAIRLHLDAAPAENGALRVIPGSHRAGKIPSERLSDHARRSAATCECAAGDALLMSPLLLHSSPRSESPDRRRVLHFEYARREELHPDLEWSEAVPPPRGWPGPGFPRAAAG